MAQDREIKFPRTPPSLDLRKKLMPRDILDIGKRYNSGESSKKLAAEYGVVPGSIRFHVCPATRLATLMDARAREKGRSREDKRERQRRARKRKLQVVPAIREYNNWRSHKRLERIT